jgi:hypothetical protein
LAVSASPTPRPVSSPTLRDPGYVTRAEYGADWPFTVPAGTLHCYDDPLNDRMYVTFSHEGEPGVEYAINVVVDPILGIRLGAETIGTRAMPWTGLVGNMAAGFVAAVVGLRRMAAVGS